MRISDWSSDVCSSDLPLTMLIVALISVAIYWGAIAPFNKGQDAINWVLATVAIDIALRAAAQMIWGKSVMRATPFFGDDLVEFWEFVLETQQVAILAGLVVLVALLTGFVRGPLWGKALPAAAPNRRAAGPPGLLPGVTGSARVGAAE